MIELAGLQAIEVIDLDHAPLVDEPEGVERWRTVVKGTCVWIEGMGPTRHTMAKWCKIKTRCSGILGIEMIDEVSCGECRWQLA